VLAFLGLFAWLKALKYLTLLDTFRLLIKTLEKAVYAICVFALLLAVIIFGFAVAFYVGFFNSEGVREFRTLESSVFTLFFMIARGVSITDLFSSTHWLPEAVFYAYIIIIYFILLAMFMAIILD